MYKRQTHTSKLFDLFIRSTGSGIGHHEDVVIFIKSLKKCFCKLISSFFPGSYTHLDTDIDEEETLDFDDFSDYENDEGMINMIEVDE